MSDKEWETFFNLLNKIVDMPGKTQAEKLALVKSEAGLHGGDTEMNLEEFAAWDFES